MENKPAQNIQDSFLNTARKEKLNITIYLLSGVKLTGRIRSFDKYSVVLETNNQEQLIFKHAISTVVMGRVPHTFAQREQAGGCHAHGGSGSGDRIGHRRLRRDPVAQRRFHKVPQGRRGAARTERRAYK